jgi:hypothetical protein
METLAYNAGMKRDPGTPTGGETEETMMATFRTPVTLWRKLRSVAALEGKSGSEALREAAEEWLAKREKTKPAAGEE